MVPLIGYVDWFSARPGERIAVKVSSRLTEPYQADLVRIVHGDANPAGPGLKFEEVAAAFAGTYPSRFQPAFRIVWDCFAVQQRHHAEVAVCPGPQLPRQRRRLRRRVVHDAQLADVPLSRVLEEIRGQVERLRKDAAQDARDPVEFTPVGLQGRAAARPDAPAAGWVRSSDSQPAP